MTTTTLTQELAETHDAITTLEIAIAHVGRLLQTCRSARRRDRLHTLRRWYQSDVDTLRGRLTQTAPFAVADYA